MTCPVSSQFVTRPNGDSVARSPLPRGGQHQQSPPRQWPEREGEAIRDMWTSGVAVPRGPHVLPGKAPPLNVTQDFWFLHRAHLSGHATPGLRRPRETSFIPEHTNALLGGGPRLTQIANPMMKAANNCAAICLKFIAQIVL